MTEVVIGDCRLICGDALDVLPTLEPGCVDAVVTDPPAGIAFMGKEWDSFPSGGRGNACRKTGDGKPCEAAGFAKDVHWEYGTSARGQFIAFLSAVAVECLRLLKPGGYGLVWAIPRTSHWTATALENAGFEIRDRISHLFGTGFPKGKGCLKPACEDWWLVRKPGKGVAPLSIDECRIPGQWGGGTSRMMEDITGGNWAGGNGKGRTDRVQEQHPAGRWPANVTHDGSDEVLEAFAAFGEKPVPGPYRQKSKVSGAIYGNGAGLGSRGGEVTPHCGDTGTAARFFYAAKASKADRGEGNTHPTVKPTALMEWLVKLVTKPGETVLDPFGGSGSTAKACARTGRKCILIEKEPEYFSIACRRVEAEHATAGLFAETL